MNAAGRNLDAAAAHAAAAGLDSMDGVVADRVVIPGDVDADIVSSARVRDFETGDGLIIGTEPNHGIVPRDRVRDLAGTLSCAGDGDWFARCARRGESTAEPP